jgi:predicted  nucleic acid-binding Zn-ribbon protein
VLHVLVGGIVIVVALAVWRRTHVRLPGGIQLGDDPGADVDALTPILEEQRKAYDHLQTRVDTLEQRVAELERQLVAARQREAELEELLATERATAGERIAALERELAVAEARIAALEAELAAARSGA